MRLVPSLSVIIPYLSIVFVFAICFTSSIFYPYFYNLLSIRISEISTPHFHVHALVTYFMVTLETTTFLSTTVSTLLTIHLVSKVWDRREVIFFLSLVFLLPALTLFVVYYLDKLLAGMFLGLLSQDIAGGLSVVGATTVLYKQHDAQLAVFKVGRVLLQAKHIPFCTSLLFLLCWSLSLISSISFLLFAMGFFYSWLYLRFFQRHPHGKYGDHRATFSFAKFFPGVLGSWVALPSNIIYRLCLRTGLCPSLERDCEIISTATFAAQIPFASLSDTERHRRLALKALNERLSKTSGHAVPSEATEWPSLDDEALKAVAGVEAHPSTSLEVDDPAESASQAKV